MCAKILFLLLLTIFFVNSIKVIVEVDRSKGPVCFYQLLRINEKYKFTVTAEVQNFRVDIMFSKQVRGTRWKQVVSRNVVKMKQQISKLADQQGTYSFCVSTSQGRIFNASLDIQTGLQQANFQYLPSISDHKMVERQIEWMQNQKNILMEYIKRIQNQHSSNEHVKNMLGITMIILAIIGIIVLALVNISFYMLVYKGLKDRKLI